MRRGAGMLAVIGFGLGIALASPSCTCGGGLECDGGVCHGTDGCIPQSCSQLGKNCGQVFNGCLQVFCGTCTAPMTCGANQKPNVCGCEPGAWSTVAVDAIGNVGGSPSLAIDQNGSLHASYRDETNHTLKYAMENFGNEIWFPSVVFFGTDGGLGDDVGEENAIAVDAVGARHIGYSDRTNGGVRYAQLDLGVWTTELIDDAGAGGISIAVDDAVTAHVAYRDPAGGLWYARKPLGSTWSLEAVDTSAVGPTSIAAGRDGGVWIAYLAGPGASQVRLAQRLDVGQYGVEVVDPADSGYLVDLTVSVAVDTLGRVHLAHRRSTAAPSPQQFVLHSQRATDGGWSAEVVDARAAAALGPYGVSLAVDSNARVHYAFSDSAAADLLYMVRSTGGIWSAPELVDSAGSVGYAPSLAITRQGVPHIVSRDESNQDLRASVRCQ